VWEFSIEEAWDERPSVRKRVLRMFLVFCSFKGQHVDLGKQDMTIPGGGGTRK
jgi:hypothetical protein